MPSVQYFPIEKVLEKNITLKAGNCNHRRDMPQMIELVRSGVIRPEQFLTQKEPLQSAVVCPLPLHAVAERYKFVDPA
jgi:threonine dehydrogenase-like Zn-dependent dehydrogenase